MANPFPQLKAGLSFGKWMTVSWLGAGGNGQVWLAKHESGSDGALKILTKIKPTAYARFRDEVNTLKGVSAIPGVVPVLDSNVPKELSESQAWYAMPVGTRFADWAKGKSPIHIASAIARIAGTLGKLHERDIVHRDIKPANLLVIDEIPYLGDFGLVDFPDKEDVTSKAEEVGPRWTMAPEVKRDGSNSGNGKPADVFSLAKTLWILLANVEKGFDGQYSGTGSIGLKQWLGDYFVEPLETLLTAATDSNPSKRPTMQEFASGLHRWCELEKRFPERNGLEWVATLSQIFPLSIPSSAKWIGLEEIVRVMNVLGARNALNHLFFPRGGGLDLESASASANEPGCIEFIANGQCHLFRPGTLSFESFNSEPEWNYFRIDCGNLEPSGTYESRSGYPCEELLRLGFDGTYVDRSYWDAGEYSDEPLPAGSRVVTRHFRGAFVIFQKTSTYNRNLSTYDGRHNKMSADVFREYIAKAAEVITRTRVGSK